MALAILKYEGCTNNTCQFKADIGTNSFYKYVIGKAKIQRDSLSFLDEITYESQIFKKEDKDIFDSSFPLEIDTRFFDSKSKLVQLMSYKDIEGKSPAFSDVNEVFPLPFLSAESPELGLSKFMNKMNYSSSNCRSVAFNYAKAPISRTMFWQTLLQVVGTLAPALLNALPSVVNTINNPPPNGKGGNENINTQQIIDLISKVLQALQQQPAAGVITAVSKPADTPLSQTKIFRATRTKALPRNGVYSHAINRNSYGRAMDGGIISGPMLAAIAGPLLSSLLGPLVQQAPQLLQTVLDSPIKMLNAATERELAQKQQNQGYLERLTADINQRALLEQLIRAGGLGQQAAPLTMSFIASKELSIEFVQTNPISVKGKPKFVYLANADIKLIFKISSKDQAELSVLPKAIVHLMVKDSINLQLLFEKKFKMKDFAVGSEIELQLNRDELLLLPKNKDLLIGANLVWLAKGSQNQKGTYSNHFIYLSNGYLLKEMGAPVSEEIPLNDVVAHRSFWHKIWEGGGNRRRWELELDSKYLCIYKYEADTNGRLETRMQLVNEAETDEDGRLKLIGKMKAGLEVSPVELNNLLPVMGSYAPISPEQLQAIRTDDLEPEMNQEANVRIELKGKRDERGVIWVYPELIVHDFFLQKVVETNENGQVVATLDETIHFPRINSFHFVGAKTERD